MNCIELLSEWLRALPPDDLSFAIKDLCKRYSVDIEALSREAWMDWDDLTKLAADPNVTIGSATVNYPALSSLRDADAQREIAMGKAVAQAAFHRDIRHFAYPFGDRGAWRRQHVVMAEEAGFTSAASALSGVIEPLGRTNLHALPRIDWDGTAALAADDAGDPVRHHLRAGAADAEQSAHASGFDIQLMIGIAGSTQPSPATT